jgi:membrane protease YdiL (CAAX protease family)
LKGIFAMENSARFGRVTFRGVRWLLLFVFFLQFLIPYILEIKWPTLFGTDLPETVSILSIQVFAVAIPCIVFLYLNSADYKETLKLKPLNLGRAIMCALIGMTAQSVASVLNIPMLVFVLSRHGSLPELVMDTPQSLWQLLWGALFVAFIPSVFEELLMRGIVLTATQSKGYRASLLIGGLYFALLHNQYESIVGHFFLGFVLCYVVWMTESVVGGIIAHFFFNLSGMVYGYWVNVVSKTSPCVGTEWFHWTVTGVCILLFFLFFGTINRKRVRRNKSRRIALQILGSVFNLPVILIVLGYILFQVARYV